MYTTHRYFSDMIALMTSVTALMISYDLIKTIRDPFQWYEGRLLWMKNVSIAFLIPFFIYAGIIACLPIQKSWHDEWDIYVRSVIFFVFIVEQVFNVKSIWVTFKCWLGKRGFNKQIKKNIFQRQVIFVILRFVTSIPYVISGVDHVLLSINIFYSSEFRSFWSNASLSFENVWGDFYTV